MNIFYLNAFDRCPEMSRLGEAFPVCFSLEISKRPEGREVNNINIGLLVKTDLMQVF